MILKMERDMDSTANASDTSDTDLVTQSLSGNREAFGQIVARYQTLICSLAYSGTGSLSQSEDLAQETFLAAFKQLASLREPQKLRSWLCSIARNLIHDTLKKQGHEPSHAAQPLDEIHEPPAPEPHPREATISREEQAILWQAVERVPEIYREPLILFYREHKSIETVARQLDLTEDTVKQRLSRGRKLLHEQVMAFVEGALERTSPSQVFTLGVLALLPVMTFPAKALAFGVAGKGVAAAKGAAVGVTFGAVFTLLMGYVLGIFLGVLGGYIAYRLSLKSARTPRERASIYRYVKIITVGVVLFYTGFSVLNDFPAGYREKHPGLFAAMGTAVALGYGVFIYVIVFRQKRKFAALREEEQRLHPELFPDTEKTLPSVLEYRSRMTFLGLPLVHIRLNCEQWERDLDRGWGWDWGWGQKTKPAIGWIAIGDRAWGILFACGGFAVGGISMGGMSAGIISVGGGSLGLLALGGFAFGAVAMGGAAFGWVASGGLAVGLHAVMGGLAFAPNRDASWEFFLRHGHLLLHFNNWWHIALFFAIICAPILMVILIKSWLRRKALKIPTMNKIAKHLILALAAIVLLTILPRVVAASGPNTDANAPKPQAVAASRVPGNWEGTLNAGAMKFRIQVRVKKTAGGKLKGTLVCPEQSPKPVPLTACNETATGATFAINVGGVAARFKGSFNADGSLLTGQWKQNGQTIPLELKRQPESPKPSVRPQTPRAGGETQS